MKHDLRLPLPHIDSGTTQLTQEVRGTVVEERPTKVLLAIAMYGTSNNELRYQRHIRAYDAALNTAKEAILSLVDIRDFLGYQLSHANGCISDEELDKIADEYLSHEQTQDTTLVAERAARLALVLGDKAHVLNAELISAIFKCDIDVAQRALDYAARRLNNPSDDYFVLAEDAGHA